MYVSKKALVLLAIAASGAHAYKVTPPPAKTVNRQSFLQKAGVAGAAFLVSASAGVLPSDAASFDSSQQYSDNFNSGRNEFNVKRDGQYDANVNQDMQRGMNKNFGNIDTMNRNMQGNNNLMSSNKFNRDTAPKVRSWPEAQYLAPIQELDNSLAMLKRELNTNKGAEGIQEGSRMMENFFQKSNNKKTFMGLASTYSKNIQFQDPTDSKVRQFENSFRSDADETVRAMEEVRNKLKTLANKRADKVTPDVLASIDKAQYGVKNFLNKVPMSDVESARFMAKSSSFGNTWFDNDEMNFLANNHKDVFNKLKSYV